MLNLAIFFTQFPDPLFPVRILTGKMKMSWSASPISRSKPTGDVVFLLGFLLYLVSSEAQFAQTIIYEFLVVEYYNFRTSLMEPTEFLLQSKTLNPRN